MQTFYDCQQLTSITFSPTLAVRKLDLMNCFYGCENLLSIENIDKLTQIKGLSGAFRGCEVLTNITFGTQTYNNAISIKEAFKDCRKLKSVNTEVFYAFNNMDNAFRSCVALTSFTCPSHQSEYLSATSAKSAFCNCLRLVNVAPLTFTRLSSIDSMFYSCGALLELTFTHEQPVMLRADQMFMNCVQIQYVHGFENFTALSSMIQTFSGCYSLQEIHLGTDILLKIKVGLRAHLTMEEHRSIFYGQTLNISSNIISIQKVHMTVRNTYPKGLLPFLSNG